MWPFIITTNLRSVLRMRFHRLAGLAGLVVAFTTSAAIFLHIRSELSYDDGYNRSNDIYRVILHGKMGGSEFDAAVCGAPMGGYFKAEIPGVESVTRLFKIPGSKLVSQGEKKVYEDHILYVDSSFFDVFDYEFLEGEPTTCLYEPNSIVVRESFARKYFSAGSILGGMLKLDGKNYKITGVVKDDKRLTHLNFNGLISLSTLKNHPRYGEFLKTPFAFITTTYLLLRKDITPVAIQPDIDRVVDKYMNFADSSETNQERVATMSLQPVSSIHLHSDVLHELEPNSDVSIVYIYTVVAFLMTIIALINYFNIATASAIRRGKEMSIHKILGAGKREIVWQFLSETAVQTGLAIIISIALLPLAGPPLYRLMGTGTSEIQVEPLLVYYGVLFFVGLLAGIYPSLILSAFSPVFFLKRFAAGSKGGRRLRSAMVGFQFMMAMLLVSGALLVKQQLWYMQRRDKGFSADRVVVIPLREKRMYEKWAVVMKEFEQLPVVDKAAAGSAWPGNYQHRMGFQPEGYSSGDPWMMLFIDVSEQYLDLLRIKIKEGRGFSSSPGVDSLNILVNEALVKKTEWKNALSRTVTNQAGGTPDSPEIYKIVGTTRDFNYSSLHEPVKPLIIRNDPKNFRFLLLRFSNEVAIKDALNDVKMKWDALFPENPFEGFMLQTKLSALYEKEERTSKAVAAFTLIALLIASVGLFEMASNIAIQSNRENSIRKVLGGSAGSIIARQTIRYIRPVAWASVMAIPIFWYFGSEWLSQFEYRTSIQLTLLLKALFIVWFTSLATTMGVAWVASRRNPLDGIREE